MSEKLLLPFNNVNNLMKEAIEIGERLKNNIKNKYSLSIQKEEIKRSIISDYLETTLSSFLNITQNLCNRLDRESEVEMFYSQGVVRTIIEIFAMLAEVLSSNERRCLELILADQLFSASKYYHLAASEEEKKEYINIDKSIRTNAKNLIKQYGFNFPDIKSFSQSQRDKLKLSYKKVDQSLKIYLKEYTKTHRDNNLSGKEIYNAYKTYSDYIHGSRFLHNHVKPFHKNKVLGISIVLNRLMLELINEKYFGDKYSIEINSWLNKFVSTAGDFQFYWAVGKSLSSI